jgi:hypothetical protein
MDESIIAFTYQAAFHCVPCAVVKWGDDIIDATANIVYDDEGNQVRAVYDWDDTNTCGESCGTCANWAIAPEPHEPASCQFGADCRQFEFAQ